MADIVDPATRSRMMAGIRGKDTRPEIFVRSLLHRAGFRFRLHRKDLPGRPDIILPKYRTAIFVQGCFWHGHQDCHLFRLPKSRTEFWREKIGGNIERDKRKRVALTEQGWKVLWIWECGLKGKRKLDPEDILAGIETFLLADSEFSEISGTSPA